MDETKVNRAVLADLAFLLEGRSKVDVAHDLGVSGAAVGQWLGGKKISEANASRIHELAEAKRLRAATSTPVVKSRPEREMPVSVPAPTPRVASPRYVEGPEDTTPPAPLRPSGGLAAGLPGHDTARRLSAYRRAVLNYERAERTLSTLDAAPREVASIMGQVTGALRAMAAAEPTAVKLLGSPEWEAVVRGLEDALRRYPDAAREVAAVFARLDAEAQAEIQTALGPEP